MEVLLFILFIVFAIAGNRGKAEAKKRRQQQTRQGQPPAYTPPPTAAESLPGAAFDWAEPQGAMPYGDPSAWGSMAYDSPEGAGSGGSPTGPSFEGMGGSREGEDLPEQVAAAGLSTITHVVRPFTESEHSHTESSITGDIPCPPARAGQPAAPALAHPAHAGLRLDHSGVRQGILYAEILGKPRALQRRDIR